MDKQTWSFFAKAVLLVVAVQAVAAFVLFQVFPTMTDRGQFGDLFGMTTALFTGLGLVAVAYAIRQFTLTQQQLAVTQQQLQITQKQLIDSQRWNQLSATFNHLRMAEVLQPIEQELNESWLQLIDRNSPLSDADVDRLFSNAEVKTRGRLRVFINELERFATAVNLGYCDDELARRMYRLKLSRHFAELEPYIVRLRSIQNAPTILHELETLILRWNPTLPTPGPSYPPGSTVPHG